jgi:hypothetical protein
MHILKYCTEEGIQMKHIIVLLLLIHQFVSPLYSDNTSEVIDCNLSFELGKQEARQVPTCKWFWTGLGLTSAIILSGILVSNTIGMENESISAAVGVLEWTGLGFTIIFPLFFTSQPKSLPNNRAIDIECYTKGYSKTLRNRNFLSSLGGVAIGLCTIGAVALGIAFSLLMFD